MSSGFGFRSWARGAVLGLRYGSPPPAGPYRDSVSWDEKGSAVARQALAVGGPCLIARLGSSELACISYYLRWRHGRRVSLPYPRGLRRIMRVNAGVFPTDDATLDRFSEWFLAAVSRVDVMGVWFNRNEHEIIGRHCPHARLVQLESLNSVLRRDPWSAELADKTVLVVHPFARSIESQYLTKRELLFENPNILPKFQLKTLLAVQSGAGGECHFPTWMDALGHMIEQIEAIDFDVAIIGAGAYGLPLGAAIKNMGRQAVHLGGATQLLFGIRGRRWETESPDDIAPLFNEHWVRPSAEETPDVANQVEGGCYW